MSRERPKTIDEVAAEWLALRDRGGWTDTEEARFHEWLEASVHNRVAYLRVEHVWERSHRLRALKSGSADLNPPAPGTWTFSPFFECARPSSGDDHNTVVDTSSGGGSRARVSPLRRTGTWVASVVVAVIVTLAGSLWPVGSTFRTPVGGLASVPLADGSKVTLNTNSEIRVAVTQNERRVELEQGEAYFEVAKDPHRPFVVRVADKRVVAVGTKFAVRREGEEVVVVVTEGKVRLESQTSRKARDGDAAQDFSPQALPAGTLARATDAGVLLKTEPVAEAEESLSWREGVLVFHDVELTDALAEFNRYNTHKVIIGDQGISGFRVAGSFRATNVEAFVRLLERGYPLQVEQDGDHFVLRAR